MTDRNDFENEGPIMPELKKRDKERQKKIDAGEITCNIENPDCTNCSG